MLFAQIIPKNLTTMKKLLIPLLVSVLFINSWEVYASEAVPAGPVSGTWTKTNSPYLINGDILIPDDSTLTIEPGVRVEFQGHFRLNVTGTLRAEGTESEKITFTIHDTTGYSNPDTSLGSWYGIIFNNAPNGADGAMFDNDTTVFSHCIIEYGKRSEDMGDDYFYALVYMFGYSKIKFVNCDIRYCTSRGNIFKCYFSSPKFLNNRITHCRAGEMIQLIELGNALISGNLIANNNGQGLSVSFSSPLIINNIIVNNTYEYSGAAIRLNNSSAVLVNNTLCNNTTNSSGGGLYIRSSEPTLYNNIIWGNTAAYGDQVYLDDDNLSPDIYHCCIEGGIAAFGGETFSGIYENSIEAAPEFQSPSSGAGNGYDGAAADWSLKPGSNCLNAGISTEVPHLPSADYYGKSRIKYGETDIGAIEFSQDFILASGSVAQDTTWITDTVKLTGDLTVENGITLNIAAGAVVQAWDRYSINVEGRLIAEGTPDEKILFTARDTQYFDIPDSTNCGWMGVRFIETPLTNDTSVFRHCIFEFGKVPYETGAGRYGGGIYVHKYSKLKILDCEFRHNMAERGGAMWISHSEAIIKNCIVRDNTTLSYGGGIALSYANATLDGLEIFNNHGGLYGGGIYAGGKPSTPSVVNCIIYNNYGKYGAGISCHTNALISNNTICNNQAQTGGGILLYSCKPDIFNTILWGNITGSSNPNQLVTWYQASPTIKNCNIQEGLQGIGTIGEGIYEDNIDEDPLFWFPSVTKGKFEWTPHINWNISDFSPCINLGKDVPEMPLHDFFGNKRINNSSIDIGAIENQAGMLVIARDPQNSIKCEYDSVILSVSVTDTARYQWRKDGLDIPGAVSAELKIPSLLKPDEGNYLCQVSNAYGTIESNSAYVLVKETPEFISAGTTIWAGKGEQVLLKPFYRGTNPAFSWEKENVSISGAIYPELSIDLADSADEGKYRAIISNTCGADTSGDMHVNIAPELCMVTVSPTTGHNLIVWEKKSKAPVIAYNIYRESVAAGIYDRMATIPFDELSVFIDTTADPTIQAYLYKITAIDSGGVETDIDLCNPHKTIHLIVSTNPELQTTQLQWDRYYGFDYQTYTIYRSSTGLNFDPVHSLSASLNSWTDPEASAGDQFYRIAVEKPDPCVAAGGGKKAGTGPYVHSLSNMDDNKLKAGENPPDSIYIDNLSIDENMLPGSLVGRLVTIDLDTSDYYTYHLVDGEGDDDNASFSLIGDLLVSAATFDYETRNTYNVRIRTTDNAAYYLERSFVITINDTQEGTTTTGETPPDSVYLENHLIAENNNFGDPIGLLVTADQDLSDVHTYLLVSGTGDEDNIMFMITGNVLRAGYSFDFEAKNTYSVRVRSTDLAGNQIERVFHIMITDVDETVGITGLQKETLQVFPNPFTHSATISIPDHEGKTYRLILTDLSGKVYRIVEDINGPEYILKRDGLESGLYFIEIRGSGIYRGKLVVE